MGHLYDLKTISEHRNLLDGSLDVVCGDSLCSSPRHTTQPLVELFQGHDAATCASRLETDLNDLDS
jgi:hypothetical protein